MMFMPIEGALSLALEVKPELFEYGWGKRVILVGPTNLLATLKAVNSIWKQEKQEKNEVEQPEVEAQEADKKANDIINSFLIPLEHKVLV